MFIGLFQAHCSKPKGKIPLVYKGLNTDHVQTCPDFVLAKENWAPHSIWHTPSPRSLSTSLGTLQPSLPPRPSFPKSPSPQEYTRPSSVSANVWASLLPQATWITLWPASSFIWNNTVKPVYNGPSKIDKTKILMTNGSLIKVKSIAECSPWSILQYFWPALSDTRSWKPILVFLRVVVLHRFYCKSLTLSLVVVTFVICW